MVVKIDVLALAREAGASEMPNGKIMMAGTQAFEKFASLVLERAALECEKVPDWKETRGYELAESIRALKPVLEKDNL